MKFNKIFLLAATAVATLFGSCSSEDSITTGEQDGNKPFVYLSDANQLSYNFEPDANGYAISFTVCRHDSVGAKEVALTVTQDTALFNVPAKAVFADKEKETVVNVTLPHSQGIIGTPVSFTVSFDESLAGIYKQGTRQQKFTVTVVKWNSLGMGTIYDDFVFGEPAPVEILQRDDKPSVFRLVDPFAVFAGDLDGNQSKTIDITLLKKNDVFSGVTITENDLVSFTDINSGYFHSTYQADIMMYHPSVFTKYPTEDGWTYNRVLSYQEVLGQVIPGQIQLAPFYYMDGVGGWDYTQENGMVVITFPGFVPQYEADITTDFSFSEVWSGEFTSELLGKTSTATLLVGKCEVTTDDCDKRFEEQYGKVYKLHNAYADGYDLTFFAKGDEISLPASTDEIDYELQPTGIQALGKDIYAKINTGQSSFSGNKLALNITFADQDGKELYTTTETLEKVNWTTLGVGQYTDAFIAPLFGVEPPTYNVEIQELDGTPGMYRVMNPYSNSVYPLAEDDCAPEGKFLLIDATDPDGVLLNTQSLGFDWGYGEFNIVSIGSYYIEYQGVAADKLKAAGYLGTLKDGVISFPVPEEEGIGGLVIMGGKAYNADTDGSFKIVLPKAANARMKVAKNAKIASSKKHTLKATASKKFNSNFKKSSKKQFTIRKSGKAAKVTPRKLRAPKPAAMI